MPDDKEKPDASPLIQSTGSEVPPFRHKMCEIKVTAEMAWDNYEEDRSEMLIYELMELSRLTAEAILLFQNAKVCHGVNNQKGNDHG